MSPSLAQTITETTAPFSASSKAFQNPDFCLERRRPKVNSQPLLHFARPVDQHRPPDEERGRPFRSSVSLLPASGHAWAGSTKDSLSSFTQHVKGLDGFDDVSEQNDEWLDALTGPTKGLSLAQAFPSSSGAPLRVEFDWPAVTQSTVRLDWSTVVDDAVATAKESIDLSGQGVTEIPDSVLDLGTIRKIPDPRLPAVNSLSRPISRTQSGPLPFGDAAARANKRQFGRTSSGSLAFQSEAVKTAVPLQINLNNNAITASSISPALFTLGNLRMLFLRQNQLESVPPGIGRLAGLVELSLAGNSIQCLPAEIFDLHNLSRLTLHPNPFMAPPASPPTYKSGRVLGPLVHHFSIPTLNEIAIRSFLASHVSGFLDLARGREALSMLPTHLDGPFQSIINPPSWHGSRSRHGSANRDVEQTRRQTIPFDPLSNVCRSRAHPNDERVYFRPAVERVEWVTEASLTGGSTVGSKTIPILHRGCGVTCLDWLEQDVAEDDAGLL